MADWARIAHTTIAKYMKGEEPNILRKRGLTAILKKNNRYSFNHSGDNLVWRVRYKRSPMSGYGDGDTLVFPRRNRHTTATLDWRGYWAGESVTKIEQLKNRGPEQIVDIIGNIEDWQMEDMMESFADELYKDGSLAANIKGFHGVESFLGGATPDSDGFIAVNNDTYAGLSTVLQNKGGTWTGNWPVGAGSSEYDFWSPLLVDYTDTAWEAATKTWAHTCLEALRFGIIYTAKNKSNKGRMDLIVMNSELYRQFINRLDDKERINVTPSTAKELLELGFGDVQHYDGTTIMAEYGIPVGVAYGFNTHEMEVRSMQKTLFVPAKPSWNEADASLRFKTDVVGNFRFNPRYFAKWAAYT